MQNLKEIGQVVSEKKWNRETQLHILYRYYCFYWIINQNFLLDSKCIHRFNSISSIFTKIFLLTQSVYIGLTVVLREIWNISEIEKMKNCSKVQFYMGKMNFWSKCAYVSWLLRYSVFSILTKISWRIFLPKLQKNWVS